LRFRTGFITAAFLVGTIATGCSDERAALAPPPSSKPAVPASSNSTSPTPMPSASASTAPAAPADTRTSEELIAAGRSTFNANCIACHAINPRIDGALGPAVAGASLELLEARVILGEYPEGYAPRRDTRVMVPMPHLKAKLPELAAYLQSLE
jgi:mono/diheme cytochrome c family protein